MKILITGGCGFVGSNIAIFLKKRLLGSSIVTILIISSYILGSVDWTSRSNESSYKVALVQGNIQQDKKWLRSEFENTLTQYASSLQGLIIATIIAIIICLICIVKPYLYYLQELIE